MNASASATVKIGRPMRPEEAARGHFYALLACLLAAAPDDALLHRLARAESLEGDSALARAWRDLIAASSAMDGEAAGEEHDVLFAGMGKAEISIYAGYYRGATPVDHPRVKLRADLAALGLAPRPDGTEPEDHLAGLLEVMRVLVAGGAGRECATLADQRAFFEAHVAPAAPHFFAALAQAEHANYYRKVAAFGAAFLALEAQSFSLE